MIELSPEIITFVLFGAVLTGILVGFPLAYVIGGMALLVGIATLGTETTAQILYQRAYDLVQNYSLVAVPLFVFMGLMLERSGIAGTLYDALYLWLGGFRGGLAVTTVLIGTIMAACVGVIAASVTMLTLVALPSMIGKGYDKGLAAGTCCVGGTLGILIPPSIMLVVYGPMAQLSVGKLFMAAVFPGLTLAGLYSVYIVVRCILRPSDGPPVPIEERNVPFIAKTAILAKSLLPPALLISAVLGSIFFGIAPPTEAAAVGATAATLLAVVYHKFTFQVLKEVSLETMRISSFVLFIGAMSFALVGVFLMLGCGHVVEDLILSAPGGNWGAFAVIMLMVFLLGMFIDWIGILFIIVPIIAPLSVKLGMDPLWFGMMIIINLQMSFNTPPFAPAIFFVKGSAPQVLGLTTADIIRGIVPFVALIVVGLLLCVVFPQLILWLPNMMIK